MNFENISVSDDYPNNPINKNNFYDFEHSNRLVPLRSAPDEHLDKKIRQLSTSSFDQEPLSVSGLR